MADKSLATNIDEVVARRAAGHKEVVELITTIRKTVPLTALEVDDLLAFLRVVDTYEPHLIRAAKPADIERLRALADGSSLREG